MDIDEMLDDLNHQVQALEDAKTAIIEIQEEARGLIAGIQMWFEQHRDQLPEVGKE